ncbi:MAG: hypothetical protein IK004_00050 [Bacteroidales bacterium]|nr:hypothetical protein [Bacteroidales bacterium]
MPFHYIFIEDANGRGLYYISTIFDFTPYPEYDGLIFFIYNVDDNVWQSGVIKEHYRVGETLEFHGGMPLVRDKQYLAFACAYDPTTGHVSNPISEVRVEAY